MVDDYGNVLIDEEQFREHVLGDSSDLIDRMGLFAFLNAVQDKVVSRTEQDNIKRILEDW